MENLKAYVVALTGTVTRPGLQLYVFGSAMRGAQTPGDIDLLLVYADGLLPEAHELAEHMRATLVFPPCDVLVASESEAAELDLVARQEAIAVWPAPSPL